MRWGKVPRSEFCFETLVIPWKIIMLLSYSYTIALYTIVHNTNETHVQCINLHVTLNCIV